MFLGKSNVIGGVRKEWTFAHNRQMPHISIVQKFAYQLTYTAVPISWNSSTNRLVMQYQFMMYQVGTAMQWLGSGNTLS